MGVCPSLSPAKPPPQLPQTITGQAGSPTERAPSPPATARRPAASDTASDTYIVTLIATVAAPQGRGCQ